MIDKNKPIKQFSHKSSLAFGKKRTPERLESFINGLRAGWSVSKAADIAGLSSATMYDWRRDDDALLAALERGEKVEEQPLEIRKAWDQAVEDGTDTLEDEAIRRARDGVARKVFYKGDQIDVIHEYSDTLLNVMLKARRSEKFRERSDVNHGLTTEISMLFGRIAENGRPLFAKRIDHKEATE